MNTGTKLALGLFASFMGLIVLFGLWVVINGISLNNNAVTSENGIDAQYKSNQNTLAQGVQKVQEIAQVPAMYTEDLTKVFEKAISARYGEDGSKAMFQWIQEQNPNFDSTMYAKIQTVIEVFRTDYKVAQDVLLDKCNIYKNSTGTFPNSVFYSVLNYPSPDIEKKCTPIVNEYTKEVYERGTETGPIKLR